MKSTIEERAKKAYPIDRDNVFAELKRISYIAGATEQKAIDDAEWLKIKSSWEREAQINHNDENNYKQGFHDAIEKACELLKAVGVLTDDDSIMGFIKAMEE